MMLNSNKKVLIYIFLILGLFISSTSLYAYYIKQSDPNSETINSNNLIDTVTITVDNEYEFLKAGLNSSFYNNKLLSEVANRRIIKLNKDIILTSDIVLDADISIDFNSHSIDLNGYNLTIRHNYYSSLTLVNGTILNSKDTGFMYLDIINGKINNSLTDNDSLIHKYNFEYACLEFENYLNWITKKYYLDDILLLDTFRNYPITITYESSNENLVNTLGNVTRSTNDETVTLTVTISSLNETSYSFDLEVIILGTNSTLINASKDILDEYFSSYEFKTDDFDYIYYEALELIQRDPYFDFNFKYFIENVEIEYLDLLSVNGIVSLEVEAYLDSTLIDTYTYSFYSSSNYNEVKEFIRNLGLIIVSRKEDSSVELNPQDNPIISVELSDDTYYELDEFNNITRKTGMIPPADELIYAIYTFDFPTGYPLQITKQVRIYFDNIAEDGEFDLTDDDQIFYEIYTLLQTQLPLIDDLEDFILLDKKGTTNLYYRVSFPNVLKSMYPYVEKMFNEEEVKVGNFSITDLDYVPPIDFTFDILLFTTEENYELNQNPYTRVLSVSMPGILRNSRKDLANNPITADIVDSNLYNHFLNTFGPLIKSREVINNTLPFVYDGLNSSLTSFRGLEYLKNTNSFTFKNISGNLNLNELDTILIKNNVTLLAFNNCNLNDSNLTFFKDFHNLETLDLRNNNLTSLTNLGILPRVKTIYLNNNNLTSFNNIEAMYNLNNLHIDATINTNPDITALSNLKYLKSIITYNASVSHPITMDLVFHANSLTKFITMYNLGILFYYEETLIQRPTEDEILCSIILESIFYSNNQTTIIVPTKLITSNLIEYNINWTFSHGTSSISNNLLTLSNLTAGTRVSLVCSLTINSTTLSREIIVVIN